MVLRSRTTTYCAWVLICACLSLGAAPKITKLEPEKVAPVFPVEPAWTVTLDAPPSADGVMDREHVYIPLQSSWVVALGRETGVALVVLGA